ncbi:HIT domain-containing protein [Mariprofundus sp. KV]|uniref:HIT domain-containing protein n=1 Tax=Mariprofundus sp. KV TaxID=2608715 RepID=UPI0019D57F93|nr:HIT domain-containing protein [Mariprofundus sp. KV]
MKYEALCEYIEKKMRMSHIYQPVMLMEILKNRGKRHQLDIAKELLSHDQSQIEYYTKITNNMVGKVLRNNEVVTRDKDSKYYEIIGFEELSPEQVEALISLCQNRLGQFLESRGDSVYQHRKKSTGYISGTIRYEVLKRAQFRCELCGISAAEKALEVDHIVPRNHGGSDNISNFQSLCYSCNAMKRDRDDTDFRGIREMYNHRQSDCLFCQIPTKRIISENELAYAIRDSYPVTELHTLVIPKRHITTYFELGQAEINACNSLLLDLKNIIETDDSSVSGFNIGINNGESAGQTIFHCHIHLIPRRDGDVENPRGGVRHSVMGSGYY